MVGPGPRHLLEEIIGAQRFDQGDRDILLRQRQSEAQPHRPAPTMMTRSDGFNMPTSPPLG